MLDVIDDFFGLIDENPKIKAKDNMNVFSSNVFISSINVFISICNCNTPLL